MNDRKPACPVAERGGALHRAFHGDNEEIRATLRDFCDALARLGVDAATIENVELVLAEVLNNIIEHAYDGHGGAIEVEIQFERNELTGLIFDDGRPMPGEILPQAALPDISGPRAAMPEGGFGWFLIRHLTSELDYSRRDGQNRVRFRLERQQRPGMR